MIALLDNVATQDMMTDYWQQIRAKLTRKVME